MSARLDVVHATALYDGQHHLGDVAELANGQWAALDQDGKRIGLFDKRAEAERVLIARRAPRTPDGDR